MVKRTEEAKFQAAKEADVAKIQLAAAQKELEKSVRIKHGDYGYLDCSGENVGNRFFMEKDGKIGAWDKGGAQGNKDVTKPDSPAKYKVTGNVFEDIKKKVKVS